MTGSRAPVRVLNSKLARLGPALATYPDGAFSPRSIPGLALWFDASDPTTLFQDSLLTTLATATSDPIGGWRDKSGNGRDLLQPTSGKRPILDATGLNGRPTVKPDAVDDFLVATGFTLAQPVTVYIVFQRGSALTSHVFDSADTAGIRLRMVTSGTVYSPGAGNSPTGGSTNTTAHVASILYSGASSIMEVDGSAIISADMSTGSLNGLTLFAALGGTANFTTTRISQLLAYTGAHTSAVRTQMLSYLRSAYGTP